MINNIVETNTSKDEKRCSGCSIYNPTPYDCNKCVHSEISNVNSWKVNVFRDSSK